MRGSFATLEDDDEKQATAAAEADSLREWKKERQRNKRELLA